MVNIAMKWIAAKIMNARKVWERLSPTSNNEKWIYDHVSKLNRQRYGLENIKHGLKILDQKATQLVRS